MIQLISMDVWGVFGPSLAVSGLVAAFNDGFLLLGRQEVKDIKDE
jgi:hypothetical protein